MERFSEIDKSIEILNKYQYIFSGTEYCNLLDSLEYLKKYEDTGLEPEEITKVIKSGVPEWIDKYIEYRKLEEQGLLIKFPCKVGDIVYIIHDYSDLRDYQRKPLLIPIKCKVTCIIIDADNKYYYNLVSIDDLFQTGDTFDEIPGDDIYSTFEEAEKASEQ